ncbi:MAG: cyclase family protein [Bacillota bacterium]|nr:cyclase family protein [Bacillota bacterium]
MKQIDLTQIISADMPVYPGTEQPELVEACTLAEHGFKELKLTMYTHTGTHMDSPAHLFSDGLTLDQFPISQFTGPAIVVDCSNLAPGSNITADHLSAIEGIELVDFILFYTGWDKKWGSEEYFESYPTLSACAATKIVDMKLKGVGVDAISVEPADMAELKIHQILLGNNILIIENLTMLDQLVGSKFAFSCYPLKIAAADGSPIRAVAEIF